MKGAQGGMTLIELLVTVAVVVILLTMGIPAVQTMTLNNRLTTESNKLLSSLLLARSEAVKYMFDVAVCPSNDGTSCTDSGTASTRLIYIDNDDDGVDDASDGNGTREADEAILRKEANIASGQSWSSSTGDLFITYKPSGLVVGGGETLTLTDSRGSTKCIQISAGGRPSIETCP
jgi:type IV fimbrial biogenesis protein FimT